jgi:AcrR family transcriptional regulator
MELRTDARANHDRIIQAATEAFAERGIGVEMKEIAERADVAIGTIYRHFPSKEDLIVAIARTMLEQISECIDAANAMSNPIEGLSALIAGNLGGLARFGWLPTAFIGGQLPRVHLEVIHTEMESRGIKHRFSPLIERGVREGYLRPDLDIAVATAMLEGAIMPWKNGEILRGRPPEEATAEIMRIFLEGAVAPVQGHKRTGRPAASAAV